MPPHRPLPAAEGDTRSGASRSVTDFVRAKYSARLFAAADEPKQWLRAVSLVTCTAAAREGTRLPEVSPVTFSSVILSRRALCT